MLSFPVHSSLRHPKTPSKGWQVALHLPLQLKRLTDWLMFKFLTWGLLR